MIEHTEALRVFRDRRVLVTGAAGFIGRAVARRLARCGADLTVAVRRTADAAAIVGGDVPEPAVTVWDATDAGSVEALVAATAPAVILNLAGYGVSPAQRDPGLARALNGDLPVRLARAVSAVDARGWDGARIVHAGSALEYGAAPGDLAEKTTPRPTTLYGETKLRGTTELAAELDDTGTRGITARLFTVYGPGERPGRLLPSLLRCAATGETLELSAGRQRRDFTYLDDVVEGLCRLAAAPPVPGRGHVVNLATGRLTTVREFGETAARVLGIDPRLLVWGALPTRPEEMSHDPVSVSLLVRLTDWRPRTSIEEGITATARRTAS